MQVTRKKNGGIIRKIHVIKFNQLSELFSHNNILDVEERTRRHRNDNQLILLKNHRRTEHKCKRWILLYKLKKIRNKKLKKQ